MAQRDQVSGALEQMALDKFVREEFSKVRLFFYDWETTLIYTSETDPVRGHSYDISGGRPGEIEQFKTAYRQALQRYQVEKLGR